MSDRWLEEMACVDLLTVQILRVADHWPELAPDLIDNLAAEAEENLTDLLPAGYRARIRRWDDNSDEPTQEAQDE